MDPFASSDRFEYEIRDQALRLLLAVAMRLLSNEPAVSVPRVLLVAFPLSSALPHSRLLMQPPPQIAHAHNGGISRGVHVILV